MIDPKVIEVRVHAEVLESKERKKQQRELISLDPGRWPRGILILDCETTTDQAQALTFGTGLYCREKHGAYSVVVEQIFYADDLSKTDVAILADHCRKNGLGPPKSRKQFIKQEFLRAIRAGSLIVGFNLPFDLSRIAIEACWTLRRDGGWSFTMNDFIEEETGQTREDQYAPRLIIKPKDGKGAFFRLSRVAPASPQRPRAGRQYPPIRCLDLRTLIWALDSKSHTLDSACKAKGVQGKLAGHTPTGKVLFEEIDYNRQDLRATLSLLNVLRAEFDKHPIDLKPEKAYSPASIAKAYLERMGVTPPQQKFEIPCEMFGISMQSYFGGRAECRIRHTSVPVVHTDVRSEYPTVNTLFGLFGYLTADRLRIEEATANVRNLFTNLTLDKLFDREFWPQLTFFALVKPSGDILPVRTKYNEKSSNIGINPLTSETPIWYAGPDVIKAQLMTGQVPEILRAFRIVPEGKQTGLETVALRGKVKIDPTSEDFFKAVIEARERVRADRSISDTERDSLQYFLKILANSGSYGLFVEVNPERASKNPKTGDPARAKLRVFSGEHQFETTSEIVEKPGDWYFPIFASLITAGGRLLLGMLERAVTDAGGTYLLCDTDSMAIVASEKGGLVLCPGGTHGLEDGTEAANALSWDVVRQIVARFEKLNPYEPGFGSASIIKIEDVNFASGQQRELFGYAIAAKRYALFTRTPDGDIHIEKASAHGLGFLYPPKPGVTADGTPLWVVEAWEWILREALGLPNTEPSWFSLPAMMRFTITTPEVLKVLQLRQKDLPYRDRAKPSNFILSPVIDPLGGSPVGADPNAFTLIAPFTSAPSQWYGMTWTNLYDGKSYRIANAENRLPHQAAVRTYGDTIAEYRWHPEAKSLAPDGTKCGPRTAGLLRRTPVFAAREFATIGKETNRRWEREDDISLLESDVIEYRPNETERLVVDIELKRELNAPRVSGDRQLAKTAGVSRETLGAAKRGQCIRKSSAEKLWRAIATLGGHFGKRNNQTDTHRVVRKGLDNTDANARKRIRVVRRRTRKALPSP